MKTWLTSKQAGKLMGYSSRGILDACRAERVIAKKVDGRWMIDHDDLLRYIEYRKHSNRLNTYNYDQRLEQAIADHYIYISDGNSKLGSIPQWNLSPVKTCSGATALCQKDCYALKEVRCFLNPKLAYHCNTYMVLNHIYEVEEYIDAYLTENMPALFRVHSSGDMMGHSWTLDQGQRYLNMWYRLARKHKDTQFLAFTKVWSLDYSCKPQNFTLMYSVFPDSIMEDIPQDGNQMAFCVYDRKKHPDKQYDPDMSEIVYDTAYSLPCSGSCKNCAMCWYIDKVSKNVVFSQH